MIDCTDKFVGSFNIYLGLMKKTNILNYLTIIYGILLVVSGLLKLNGGLRHYEIHAGEKYIIVTTSTSITYIVLVNFIGGLSFLYLAIQTIKSKNFLAANESGSESVSEDKGMKSKRQYSKLVLPSALITLFTAAFLLIESFAYFGFFENGINGYGVIFIMAIAIYFPFSVIPGALAAKTISFTLNNE